VSPHTQRFIDYLIPLPKKDRGALAILRHSLAFEPGAYPKAFPYVERFVKADCHERDARRLALYAVAALFARHPEHRPQSFAAAFGALFRQRKSPSIELRFVALLGADAENIFDYLRQAMSLLAADKIGCDYARLLDDLTIWMEPRATRLDHLRQRWARDFYRAAEADTDTATPPLSK